MVDHHPTGPSILRGAPGLIRARRLTAAGCLLVGLAAAAPSCGSAGSGPDGRSGAPAAPAARSAASGAGVGAGAGAGAADDTPVPTPPKPTQTHAPPQLPMGGRELLPHYRIVAHYGSAGGGALGILGEGTPEQAAERVATSARAFASGDRPVQPAMELIATVASASPGPDGLYSNALPDAEVARYLAAARAHRMLLILDLQPGRGRFLDQARRYERFLREPDVGLALDPEWKMGPAQVPGRQLGSSDAAGINEVSAWLAGLVRGHDLPQKVFAVHQFTESMIPDRAAVATHPELASVFHIDGFGGRQIKLEKYAALAVKPPYFNGFKLFLDEDTNLLTPAETLKLVPTPDLITYQ